MSKSKHFDEQSDLDKKILGIFSMAIMQLRAVESLCNKSLRLKNAGTSIRPALQNLENINILVESNDSSQPIISNMDNIRAMVSDLEVIHSNMNQIIH